MMKSNDFVGRKVHVLVVDPWDFVTTNGSGPFPATIIRTTNGSVGKTRLLLEFDTPISYKNQQCLYFVADTRLTDQTMDTLFSNGKVGVNLNCVPDERLKSAEPFDLSWWRGGLSLIADLQSY